MFLDYLSNATNSLVSAFAKGIPWEYVYKFVTTIFGIGISASTIAGRVLFKFYLMGDWSIILHPYKDDVYLSTSETRCLLAFTYPAEGAINLSFVRFEKINTKTGEPLYRGYNRLFKYPDNINFVPRKAQTFQLYFVREFEVLLRNGNFECREQTLVMNCTVVRRWFKQEMAVAVELEPGYVLKGTATRLHKPLFG